MRDTAQAVTVKMKLEKGSAKLRLTSSYRPTHRAQFLSATLQETAPCGRLSFDVRLYRIKRYMKILIFLFPITLFLIFLCIKMVSPSTYILIIQEDSAIEYAQAFFYFLSSILSFLVSVTFLRNKMTLHGILYGVLALGLLFISLEEISWGQRIFNIDNLSYFVQHNVQNEISFHNLDTVQPLLHRFYILTGAYGAFAWLFVLPFVSREKMKCRNIVNFIVPDWFISSYFFFVFLIYTLFDYIAKPYPRGFLVWRDQEPLELLLSLGFLFFLATKYIKLRTCLTRQMHSDG